MLLALSYQVALSGETLEKVTQDRISEVAKLLGVSYEEHDRIRKKYSLEMLATPYTILGLKNSASKEEIKQAYRQMVAKYHPDRVAHRGDDLAEDAHLKFLEIQSAYQELEHLRGI